MKLPVTHQDFHDFQKLVAKWSLRTSEKERPLLRACTGGTTNRQLDLEAPRGGMREQQTQYNT